VGRPNAHANFYSLHFIEGVRPRLRADLVSSSQCPQLDAIVAEEYTTTPGSGATAGNPVGDWHKVDTHLAQGAVAEFKPDGRYAILVPRYTQSDTSQGIGYTAVTAGKWSGNADMLELEDDQHAVASKEARTSHVRMLAGASNQATMLPLADSRETVRELAASPWTRIPAIADLPDGGEGGPSAGKAAIVGRWRVSLDPVVRLDPDGTVKVALDRAGLDRTPVMRGSWQPGTRDEKGVEVRIGRGDCAAEPTVVTEFRLVPNGVEGLTWAARVHGCERFEPLRGQELRGLVHASGSAAGRALSWSGDWHPQPTPYWIVAFFPSGQYEIVLPKGDETWILAFGTWSLAGNQLTLHEQAGYCQQRPEDALGTYRINLAPSAANRTLRLQKRVDTCAMRAPFDGAAWLPQLPSRAPSRDVTFDGQ
jgi:hypothetical protein